MSVIICDGDKCETAIDVSSIEAYPDGAGGVEIHVKQGNQFLKYVGRLCANCTSKLLDSFKKKTEVGT